MNMQLKLDRLLEYKDFKNPNMGEIGITLIKKYWCSLNKMNVKKRELITNIYLYLKQNLKILKITMFIIEENI